MNPVPDGSAAGEIDGTGPHVLFFGRSSNTQGWFDEKNLVFGVRFNLMSRPAS
jgi:hypothetical protein